MKKFLLAIACLFCYLSSFSQSNGQNYNPLIVNQTKHKVKSEDKKKLRINLYGGLSITALTGTDKNGTSRTESVSNFNGGISFDIKTGLKTSFGIGLGTSTLAGYITEKDSDVPVMTPYGIRSIKADVRSDYELKYIDIPLNVKFWFSGFNRSKFYIKSGFTLGILSKSLFIADIKSKTGIHLGEIKLKDDEVYNKVKLSCDVGVGGNIPVSDKIYLFLEISASPVLSNLYDKKSNKSNRDNDFSLRGYYYNFNLGIAF
ncbi:MAG: outer membrane beta-barrel protein [Hyphomicrobiales bacterium]